MTQANQARLAAGFSKTLLKGTASQEENDVNININAETEGGEQEAPEVVESAPADVDAIPLDTSETPEASELEVAEVQAEADETVDQVEELDNTLDSLESIYFTLANVSAEGAEITPALARMTHVAINNAVSRFGLNSEDCGVASVESIALAPQAEIATSMEGIAETIKSGAKQVAALMDRLISFLADFLKSILTATGRTTKRINDVENALKSFKGELKTDVNIPAVLNGRIKPSDLVQVGQVGKAFTASKYADIAVLAKSDGITGEAIKTAFGKANAAVTKYGDKEALPGYTFGTNDEGIVVLTKVETSAQEGTVSASEGSGILGAAKNMVAVANEYNGAKGVRKQVSDAIKGAINENVSKEDGNAMERFTARRKLAKGWSRQVNEETRVVGLMITYANAAASVVAQTVSGGKKSNNELVKV